MEDFSSVLQKGKGADRPDSLVAARRRLKTSLAKRRDDESERVLADPMGNAGAMGLLRKSLVLSSTSSALDASTAARNARRREWEDLVKVKAREAERAADRDTLAKADAAREPLVKEDHAFYGSGHPKFDQKLITLRDHKLAATRWQDAHASIAAAPNLLQDYAAHFGDTPAVPEGDKGMASILDGQDDAQGRLSLLASVEAFRRQVSHLRQQHTKLREAASSAETSYMETKTKFQRVSTKMGVQARLRAHAQVVTQEDLAKELKTAADDAEAEYNALAKWEERWVRDGVAEFEKADADLLKVKEAVLERRAKERMERRGGWSKAVRKLGIDKDKVKEATSGWTGVINRAGISLKAIRRLGAGADWAAIMEERKQAEKAAAADAQKAAVKELKHWASDLGLVLKPTGEFDKLTTSARRLVVEDLTLRDEIRRKRQQDAEEAAMDPDELKRRAEKKQARRAQGRRDSDASVATTVDVLATPNILMQPPVSSASTLAPAGGQPPPPTMGGTFPGGDTAPTVFQAGHGGTFAPGGSLAAMRGSLGGGMLGMQRKPARDMSDVKYPVIRSRLRSVPQLCWNWVTGKCHGAGLSCPNDLRHFFVSQAERATALRDRLLEDSILERTVVTYITERESLLDLLADAVDWKRREFEDDTSTRRPTQVDMAEVLAIMNELRVVTVRVVEAVERWRSSQAARTKAKAARAAATKGSGGEAHRTYAVRIQLAGPVLYDTSAAFSSVTGALKRMERPEQRPHRTTAVHFVGLFNSELEACSAYDEAAVAEAIRTGVNPAAIPGRRIVIKSCGKHYGVESIGMVSRPCEDCAVEALDGPMEFTAPFLWNGENYLLKILNDTDFLAASEPLKECLGPDFPLDNNPLLLAPDGYKPPIPEAAMPTARSGSGTHRSGSGTHRSALGTHRSGAGTHRSRVSFFPTPRANSTVSGVGSSTLGGLSILDRNTTVGPPEDTTGPFPFALPPGTMRAVAAADTVAQGTLASRLLPHPLPSTTGRGRPASGRMSSGRQSTARSRRQSGIASPSRRPSTSSRRQSASSPRAGKQHRASQASIVSGDGFSDVDSVASVASGMSGEERPTIVTGAESAPAPSMATLGRSQSFSALLSPASPPQGLAMLSANLPPARPPTRSLSPKASSRGRTRRGSIAPVSAGALRPNAPPLPVMGSPAVLSGATSPSPKLAVVRPAEALPPSPPTLQAHTPPPLHQPALPAPPSLSPPTGVDHTQSLSDLPPADAAVPPPEPRPPSRGRSRSLGATETAPIVDLLQVAQDSSAAPPMSTRVKRSSPLRPRPPSASPALPAARAPVSSLESDASLLSEGGVLLPARPPLLSMPSEAGTPPPFSVAGPNAGSATPFARPRAPSPSVHPFSPSIDDSLPDGDDSDQDTVDAFDLTLASKASVAALTQPFGVPNSKVALLPNGAMEWFGHMVMDPHLAVGDAVAAAKAAEAAKTRTSKQSPGKRLAGRLPALEAEGGVDPSAPPPKLPALRLGENRVLGLTALPTDELLVSAAIAQFGGSAVEVLDMTRIDTVAKVLQEEGDLAALLEAAGKGAKKKKGGKARDGPADDQDETEEGGTASGSARQSASKTGKSGSSVAGKTSVAGGRTVARRSSINSRAGSVSGRSRAGSISGRSRAGSVSGRSRSGSVFGGRSRSGSVFGSRGGSSSSSETSLSSLSDGGTTTIMSVAEMSQRAEYKRDKAVKRAQRKAGVSGPLIPLSELELPESKVLPKPLPPPPPLPPMDSDTDHSTTSEEASATSSSPEPSSDDAEEMAAAIQARKDAEMRARERAIAFEGDDPQGGPEVIPLTKAERARAEWEAARDEKREARAMRRRQKEARRRERQAAREAWLHAKAVAAGVHAHDEELGGQHTATTLFEYRGAAFAMDILRNQPPGKQPGIFCRWDGGVWEQGNGKASMRIRGRHLTRWAREHDRLKAVRDKVEDKKHIIRALGRAIKRRDMKRIDRLVPRAVAYKDPLVDEEARRALEFQHQAGEESVTAPLLQRIWRGYVGRKRARARRLQLAEHAMRQRTLDLFSHRLAPRVVEGAVKAAVRTTWRKLVPLKAPYKRVARLDGDLLLLTLTSLAFFDGAVPHEARNLAYTSVALDDLAGPSSPSKPARPPRAAPSPVRGDAALDALPSPQVAALADAGDDPQPSTADRLAGLRAGRGRWAGWMRADWSGSNMDAVGMIELGLGLDGVGRDTDFDVDTVLGASPKRGAMGKLVGRSEASGAAWGSGVGRPTNPLTADAFGVVGSWGGPDATKAASTSASLCPSCLLQRPRTKQCPWRRQPVTWRGVCTCVRERPPERVLVTGYDASDKTHYTLVVTEATLRARVLDALCRRSWEKGETVSGPAPPRRGRRSSLEGSMGVGRKGRMFGRRPSVLGDTSRPHRDHGETDDYVRRLLAAAAALEPSETDDVTGVGRAPFTRSRFEPIREAQAATAAAASAARAVDAARRQVAHLESEVGEWETTLEARQGTQEEAMEAFGVAHAAYIDALIHEQAMVSATDHAMAFSKDVLAAYENLKLSSAVNPWDQLEDANDYNVLRMKRAAQVVLESKDDARTAALRVKQTAVDAVSDAKRKLQGRKAKAAGAREWLRLATLRSRRVARLASLATHVAFMALSMVCDEVTLRWTHVGSIRRQLVLREASWTPVPASVAVATTAISRRKARSGGDEPGDGMSYVGRRWAAGEHASGRETRRQPPDLSRDLLPVKRLATPSVAAGFNGLCRVVATVTLPRLLMSSPEATRRRVVTPATLTAWPSLSHTYLVTVLEEPYGGSGLLLLSLYDRATSATKLIPVTPTDVQEAFSYSDSTRHVCRRHLPPGAPPPEDPRNLARRYLEPPTFETRWPHHRRHMERQWRVALAQEVVSRLAISPYTGELEMNPQRHLRALHKAASVIALSQWAKDATKEWTHPAWPGKVLHGRPPHRGVLVFRENLRVASVVGDTAVGSARESAWLGTRPRGSSGMTFLPRVAGQGTMGVPVGDDAEVDAPAAASKLAPRSRRGDGGLLGRFAQRYGGGRAATGGGSRSGPGVQARVAVYDNYGDLQIEVFVPRHRTTYRLQVTYEQVAAVMEYTPGGEEHWRLAVRACDYSPGLLRGVLHKLQLLATPYHPVRAHALAHRDALLAVNLDGTAVRAEDAAAVASVAAHPAADVLAGDTGDDDDPLGLPTEAAEDYEEDDRADKWRRPEERGTIAAFVLVLQPMESVLYHRVHSTVRFMDDRYLLCTAAVDVRGGCLLEVYDPVDSHRYSLTLGRWDLQAVVEELANHTVTAGRRLAWSPAHWQLLCDSITLAAAPPEPALGRVPTPHVMVSPPALTPLALSTPRSAGDTVADRPSWWREPADFGGEGGGEMSVEEGGEYSMEEDGGLESKVEDGEGVEVTGSTLLLVNESKLEDGDSTMASALADLWVNPFPSTESSAVYPNSTVLEPPGSLDALSSSVYSASGTERVVVPRAASPLPPASPATLMPPRRPPSSQLLRDGLDPEPASMWSLPSVASPDAEAMARFTFLARRNQRPGTPGPTTPCRAADDAALMLAPDRQGVSRRPLPAPITALLPMDLMYPNGSAPLVVPDPGITLAVAHQNPWVPRLWRTVWRGWRLLARRWHRVESMYRQGLLWVRARRETALEREARSVWEEGHAMAWEDTRSTLAAAHRSATARLAVAKRADAHADTGRRAVASYLGSKCDVMSFRGGWRITFGDAVRFWRREVPPQPQAPAWKDPGGDLRPLWRGGWNVGGCDDHHSLVTVWEGHGMYVAVVQEPPRGRGATKPVHGTPIWVPADLVRGVAGGADAAVGASPEVATVLHGITPVPVQDAVRNPVRGGDEGDAGWAPTDRDLQWTWCPPQRPLTANTVAASRPPAVWKGGVRLNDHLFNATVRLHPADDAYEVMLRPTRGSVSRGGTRRRLRTAGEAVGVPTLAMRPVAPTIGTDIIAVFKVGVVEAACTPVARQLAEQRGGEAGEHLPAALVWCLRLLPRRFGADADAVDVLLVVPPMAPPAGCQAPPLDGTPDGGHVLSLQWRPLGGSAGVGLAAVVSPPRGGVEGDTPPLGDALSVEAYVGGAVVPSAAATVDASDTCASTTALDIDRITGMLGWADAGPGVGRGAAEAVADVLAKPSPLVTSRAREWGSLLSREDWAAGITRIVASRAAEFAVRAALSRAVTRPEAELAVPANVWHMRLPVGVTATRALGLPDAWCGVGGGTGSADGTPGGADLHLGWCASWSKGGAAARRPIGEFDIVGDDAYGSCVAAPGQPPKTWRVVYKASQVLAGRDMMVTAVELDERDVAWLAHSGGVDASNERRQRWEIRRPVEEAAVGGAARLCDGGAELVATSMAAPIEATVSEVTTRLSGAAFQLHASFPLGATRADAHAASTLPPADSLVPNAGVPRGMPLATLGGGTADKGVLLVGAGGEDDAPGGGVPLLLEYYDPRNGVARCVVVRVGAWSMSRPPLAAAEVAALLASREDPDNVLAVCRPPPAQHGGEVSPPLAPLTDSLGHPFVTVLRASAAGVSALKAATAARAAAVKEAAQAEVMAQLAAQRAATDATREFFNALVASVLALRHAVAAERARAVDEKAWLAVGRATEAAHKAATLDRIRMEHNRVERAMAKHANALARLQTAGLAWCDALAEHAGRSKTQQFVDHSRASVLAWHRQLDAAVAFDREVAAAAAVRQAAIDADEAASKALVGEEGKEGEVVEVVDSPPPSPAVPPLPRKGAVAAAATTWRVELRRRAELVELAGRRKLPPPSLRDLLERPLHTPRFEVLKVVDDAHLKAIQRLREEEASLIVRLDTATRQDSPADMPASPRHPLSFLVAARQLVPMLGTFHQDAVALCTPWEAPTLAGFLADKLEVSDGRLTLSSVVARANVAVGPARTQAAVTVVAGRRLVDRPNAGTGPMLYGGVLSGEAAAPGAGSPGGLLRAEAPTAPAPARVWQSCRDPYGGGGAVPSARRRGHLDAGVLSTGYESNGLVAALMGRSPFPCGAVAGVSFDASGDLWAPPSSLTAAEVADGLGADEFAVEVYALRTRRRYVLPVTLAVQARFVALTGARGLFPDHVARPALVARLLEALDFVPRNGVVGVTAQPFPAATWARRPHIDVRPDTPQRLAVAPPASTWWRQAEPAVLAAALSSQLEAWGSRRRPYRATGKWQVEPAAHFDGMLDGDAFSHDARPFLAAPSSDFFVLRQAFSWFDPAGTGHIPSKYMQDVMFEMEGRVVRQKTVTWLLEQLDPKSTGTVSLNNFMLWWFVHGHTFPRQGNGLAIRVLRTRLQYRQNARHKLASKGLIPVGDVTVPPPAPAVEVEGEVEGDGVEAGDGVDLILPSAAEGLPEGPPADVLVLDGDSLDAHEQSVV